MNNCLAHPWVRLACWRLMSAAVLALAACGDGGGDGGNGQAPVTLSVFPQETSLSRLDRTSFVPRNELSLFLESRLDPPVQVYIAVEEPLGLLADAQLTDGLLTIVGRTDLAPGHYESSIALHLCRDEACSSEYPGSPRRVPLVYDIYPNFEGPGPVTLQRTGGQVLDAVDYPMTIPERSRGPIFVSMTPPTDAIGAELVDGKLRITPKFVRAGTYTTTVVVANWETPDYHWQVPVTYRVDPPAGGELAFAIDRSEIHATVVQGESATVRLKVTAPTWLPNKPTLSWNSTGSVPWATWTEVAPNEYDFILSGTGLSLFPCCTAPLLNVDPGPFGGQPIELPVSMTLVPVLRAEPALFDVLVTANSTATDLRFSVDLEPYAGRSITWQASTTSNRLTLLRTTGTAGVDRLTFEVNAANVTPSIFWNTIDVRPNAPGVPPLVVGVYTAREVVAAGRERPLRFIVGTMP